MSIAIFLKYNLKNIPPSLGRLINKIPYSYRPGLRHVYRTRREEISIYESYSSEQKQNFIFEQMKRIVEYAYNNIYAYKDFYNKSDFHPSKLKDFSDINTIPIINKSILNQYTLEERSSEINPKYIVNTGGSSGTPFGFYIEPSSMGHEWAHMHTVWGKFGYKVSDLKIGFGGRSDIKKCVEYDVVRNNFAVDIYASYQDVSVELKKILKRYNIKYIHGYPTSIYDFALYCDKYDKELKELLSKRLVGAFLGSEYPHEQYRTAIENIFNIKSVSWYGHTERCVLAYEKKEKFVYEPFVTYGFSEAVEIESQTHLIGTSYYNNASPLIRYNTSDIISDIEIQDGILNSFQITQGREGEFIFDKKGKKINLTGFIFGRHHELFNHSKFIQVKDNDKGEIEIHFVSDNINIEKAASMFDINNIDLDIIFVKKEEPTRTISGKINLLIK